MGGVAHGIAELEVEGSTGLACAVNPVADGVRAVPALTDGELWLGTLVIHLRILCRVALHHVVAEAYVAQVVEQHVQIGFHTILHVRALVVQVTHTVPSLAGVVVGPNGVAFRGCLVILADVLISELVGHAVVGLCREVRPR